MESNFHRRWWLTSPVHQGDHGGAVKTIAQGMPCDFGGPCKCACVFSFLHAKLRVHRASGIPCALYVLKAREILAKLGRMASRDRGGASVLLPSPQRARARRGRGEESASNVRLFENYHPCHRPRMRVIQRRAMTAGVFGCSRGTG